MEMGEIKYSMSIFISQFFFISAEPKVTYSAFKVYLLSVHAL